MYTIPSRGVSRPDVTVAAPGWVCKFELSDRTFVLLAVSRAPLVFCSLQLPAELF
jgi:hypothetical protein